MSRLLDSFFLRNDIFWILFCQFDERYTGSNAQKVHTLHESNQNLNRTFSRACPWSQNKTIFLDRLAQKNPVMSYFWLPRTFMSIFEERPEKTQFLFLQNEGLQSLFYQLVDEMKSLFSWLFLARGRGSLACFDKFILGKNSWSRFSYV